MDRILYVDGDYLAYLCAASIENRSIAVYDKDETLVGNYKNRTTFKNSSDCTEDYKTYIVKDEQNVPDDWEKQLPMYLKTTVNSWLKETGSTDLVVVLGAKENHRDSVLTPTKYKDSRKEVLKPILLQQTKQMLEELYDVERPLVGEADDKLAYVAYDAYLNNKDVVICTVDKDHKMVPTKALFNPQTKDITSIPMALGEIHLKTSPKYKVVAKGRFMCYVQMLLGDMTDSYAPCDVYKHINKMSRVSPMLTDLKVYELLKGCSTDRECWEVLIAQYKEWYGDGEISWVAWDGSTQTGTYLDVMQMNFTFLWMKRFEDDYPQVRNILASYDLLPEEG